MRSTVLSAVIGVLAVSSAPAPGQSVLWVQQLGTPLDDRAFGAAADGAGYVYITGYTRGSLGGPINGEQDAFLAKYDSTGTLLWIRQFATGFSGNGVAVDSAGSVYVAGYTTGIPGISNDAFLAKFDGAGTLLWFQQFGTGADEIARDVAVDGAGHVHISGWTSGSLGGSNAGFRDAFLAKYDSAGVLLWIRQLGTTQGDQGDAVAVDTAGHAYLGGYGFGGGFLAKYDTAGTHLWTVPTGFRARGVAVDPVGQVYFGGGAGNGIDRRVLAKYDSAGNHLWTWLAPDSRIVTGVAVDSAGRSYIGGNTGGNAANVFVASHDSAGAVLWIHEVISPGGDFGEGGVALDSTGDVYLAGSTFGNLGGLNAGELDAFLMKFGTACYPDCDGSGALTVADFGCFQTKFVAADPYADCNGDGSRTVADFGCFQTRFVAGCP